MPRSWTQDEIRAVFRAFDKGLSPRCPVDGGWLEPSRMNFVNGHRDQLQCSRCRFRALRSIEDPDPPVKVFASGIGRIV